MWRNKNTYEAEVSSIKKYLFNIKRKFYFYEECKKCVIFEDGASIDMQHNSKLDIQTSNPNPKSVNIYPYTPFVGLRGIFYIIEKILNIQHQVHR